MALVTLALLVAAAALFAALYALTSSPSQEIGAVAQYGGEQPGAGAGQVGVTSDGGDSLPFTGLVAIPLLILAAALLASGVAMRRRARGADIE